MLSAANALLVRGKSGTFYHRVNSGAVTGLPHRRLDGAGAEFCPPTLLPRPQQEKQRASHQLPNTWALASHLNLGSWLAPPY